MFSPTVMGTGITRGICLTLPTEDLEDPVPLYPTGHYSADGGSKRANPEHDGPMVKWKRA